MKLRLFLAGLLTVGDKLSMANGIDERYPFLDNDLVDFVQKNPVRFKLGDSEKEIAKLDENYPSNRNTRNLPTARSY